MVLSALSTRLRASQTFEEAIATILDDVIAFHGAEYGNVQLPIGDELAIVAQRGLPESFLRTFRRVKKENGCACGRAFRSRRPVVIKDVTKDIEFAAYLKDAEAAGFRAVQTTPLFTGDGLLFGMVSTHFSNVHEPTPFEIEILQSYSVVAAEHGYQLLGKTTLAEKAGQMNARLYASVLAPTSA
jgi:GAF domain-containing protein